MIKPGIVILEYGMQTYFPQGIVKEFVDSIYYLSGKAMGTGVAFPRVQQVIIINLGSNFNVSDVYNTSRPVNEFSSTVWVNGKHDTPFMLGNNGTTAMYAISIKLGMLPYFAAIPACETNDLAVDAVNWTSKEIFNLREQLLGTDTSNGFRLIEKFLLNMIRNKELHNLEKIKWLGTALYNSSVAEIGRALGATRKRLRNEALFHFGSSLKNIQGIIRFNQTLANIANGSDQSLSRLHDYYDQSHFINDFKARTGITPLQYKRLCQQIPAIKYTPNFLSLEKETFLQFIGA